MSVESGVLVIHCSDPRFQGAFHDFVTHELQLEKYALLAVPGGPQFLTALEYLPKFSWAGWRWMKFLKKLGNTDRVILIAHDDCRWYAELPLIGAFVRDKQVRDARAVCSELGERLGTSRVEMYWARMEGDRIRFETM